MSVIDHPRCTARQRGTAVGYRYYRCRCGECSEAHRAHNKLSRDGAAPPALIGAARTQYRIRALLASGFSGTDIARRAGWDSRRRVYHLLNRRQIRPRTAEVIERLYADLA